MYKHDKARNACIIKKNQEISLDDKHLEALENRNYMKEHILKVMYKQNEIDINTDIYTHIFSPFFGTVYLIIVSGQPIHLQCKPNIFKEN